MSPILGPKGFGPWEVYVRPKADTSVIRIEREVPDSSSIRSKGVSTLGKNKKGRSRDRAVTRKHTHREGFWHRLIRTLIEDLG